MNNMTRKKELARQNILTLIILVVTVVVIVFVAIWFLKMERMEKQKVKGLMLEGLSVFFPKQEISALLYDGNHIWVGGREGIILMNPQTGEIVKEVATDIHMTYTAGMCRTPDGSVWVGHEKGISIFKEEVRVDFVSPQIPKGRVNTLIEDGKGGVWAGMQAGAVHFIMNSDSWIIDKTLSSSSGLSDDTVNAIGIDGRNGVWFGSYLVKNTGGISILRNNQWKYFSTEEGLPHRYVTAIIPISSKYILVGGGHLDRGGMALFEQKGIDYILKSTYSIENGLPGEKIRQLFLDSRNHLWITSESDGLLICNSYKDLLRQQLEGVYLTTQNGLSDNEIKTIIEAEGYYWLGGRYGLTRIKESTIELLFSSKTHGEL